MRHVPAALVAAAVPLQIAVPPPVIPSGHVFQLGIEGSGHVPLWAFVRKGRAPCTGTPYEEQGTPIISGQTVEGDAFSLDVLLRRRELGPYTVCAYLGEESDRAVFSIGPPALRSLGLVVTGRQGRSARTPGATV